MLLVGVKAAFGAAIDRAVSAFFYNLLLSVLYCAFCLACAASLHLSVAPAHPCFPPIPLSLSASAAFARKLLFLWLLLLLCDMKSLQRLEQFYVQFVANKICVFNVNNKIVFVLLLVYPGFKIGKVGILTKQSDHTALLNYTVIS